MLEAIGIPLVGTTMVLKFFASKPSETSFETLSSMRTSKVVLMSIGALVSLAAFFIVRFFFYMSYLTLGI
ncbi:MAG: hypothetical protein LUB61_02985 [Eggerthellaceae bacterium]|nr:hypothetical protein [Eggerthellaceae bacterium]